MVCLVYKMMCLMCLTVHGVPDGVGGYMVRLVCLMVCLVCMKVCLVWLMVCLVC